VNDAEGKEVPSQVENGKILFLASAPSAKAEASDEIILRMVELDGKNTSDVHVSFAGPIVAAREVNAQEQPIGPADMTNGELKTSFTAYQPRTFALRLNSAPTKLSSIKSQPISKNPWVRENAPTTSDRL
jgi:Glycosyl hydrolases family 38 C-terminal beta sandwich domain